MVELPTVTLLAIDTANHGLALRALARCQAQVRFGRTLFLTDAIPAGVDVPASVEIATIAPIASRADYSTFVLKGLLPYTSTSHLLLAQWDGYVIDANAWQPAFLDCDYIGAKWFWRPAGRRVGNGGFSLRSRRLLEALQDSRISLVDNEDMAIGDTFRPLLESTCGIRFADEAMADRFAFEAAHPIGRPFGFHGLFNFCRAMPASELAALASQFSAAIACSPQLAQLLRNCVAMGQWPAAIAIARRRLAALPADAEAKLLLAQAETAARQAPAAGRNEPCPCGSGKRFKQCHGAIAAPPPAGGAPAVDDIVQSALTAHQRGDLAVAERDYRTALARAPEHPVALHFLGVIAYQCGRSTEALPLLERAVALRPEEPEFHNNLGLAQVELDRHEEAIDAYHRALAHSPAHATAWCNLGLALTGANRLTEAIDSLRRAIALRPDFAEAHWNLALALLAVGDFAVGWREYEWRLAIPRFAVPAPSTPRWTGEDASGKTLLLRAEQGLGDTLHFVRFAGVLAALGARVLVQAPRPLVRLVATVPGVSGVHAADDTTAARYDAHIELLSVPGKLAIDGSNIPAAVPYLSVDRARAKTVAAEVEKIAGTALRVGLVWAGSRTHANDRRRSCPLATLAPMLDAAGTAWFSLQQGHDDDASIAAAPRLVRLDARNDFDGNAALIAALDLVVTVDTSIAHLAGAMARPTWILLPFAADWRWRETGDSSRWYPTARLFRQPRRGDWASVVRAVSAALATLASTR
jgi:tetratricopeptide (TPR) repeat protein